jgi:peptide/nickel transport system substrate-binding protein
MSVASPRLLHTLLMRTSSVPTFGLVIAVAVACDRQTPSKAGDEAPGGSLVAALQSDVGQVIPPTIQQVDQKMVADQIFEPLAWLGDESRTDGDFRPALADSWNWERDSMVVAFHMNPNARWHDGAPVRASDVRFTYALYTDSTVGSQEAQALERIDSVTVRDSLTPVFWFNARYPEQLYDAAVRMLIVPEHLLANEPRATLQTSAFGRKPVGSGRFRLAKWSATSLELVADTMHYRGRAKLDRVIFALTGDPNTLVPKLTTGEVDAADIATSDQFRALSTKSDFKARILPAFDYGFLQFNLRDPRRHASPHRLFGDVAFRRALTMALDRQRLVRSQFDTLGTVALGPMTRAQPLADTTLSQIPYDSAGAARLLDSLGWKLPQGKQIRERNGQPLAFRVIVPTISRNRMAMVVRVQEAYRAAGVQVDIDAIDPPTFMARLNKRDFDVAFNGTRAELSVSGLRPYWNVAGARDPRGHNYGTYENPAFDAHLDSALTSADIATARAHASKAFATIVADAPAVWMYETRTASVTHKRFRTAHVVPTAWWLGIGDWFIPPDERLPRDRVGLRVASR